MSKIIPAWQFIGQALSEYAATLQPAARAGFAALAQSHCDVLQPAIEAAHAKEGKPVRRKKAALGIDEPNRTLTP